MTRQFVQDFAVSEDSKIIQDDDKFLVVKAVIAVAVILRAVFAYLSSINPRNQAILEKPNQHRRIPKGRQVTN